MIPFLDLKTTNAPYEAAFQSKFREFLEKGWYVLGDEVSLFESEFAAYCGTQFCVGVANGLDALRLIIEGYKILGKLKEGDEVLVASNTYIATILGIKQAGLVPVLVEAESDTFNFCFEDLVRKVTPQTKVIMPTHLYGQLADMERVSAFAKAHSLLIVTDSAQSHGAQASNGKRSGALGDASGFSFYPTKNLGALGDGGAITTDDAQLVGVVKQLRNYGFKERYVSQYVGLNSRLDEIQAAFLRIKLRSLDTENKKRRAIAKRYLSEISNPKLILPKWNGDDAHVFHLFVIQTKERNRLKDHFKNNNVAFNVHYPIPPHKQEALAEYATLSFPICERIHQEVLSVPLHPALSESDVTTIIEMLNSF